MKQLKTFFVHLSILMSTFLLCGCPGGDSYSINVSTRNIELSNQVQEAQFTITGRFGEDNAEWTINKNGDDFVELSSTSGYGTEQITVRAKDVNQKEDLQCNLTIACGDKTANVLITLKYVIDPDMAVEIDDKFEILQMAEGIVCQVCEFGSNVEECYMALYDKSTMPATDNAIIEDIKKNSNKKIYPSYPESISTEGIMKAEHVQTNPVVAWYGEKIKPNHSYTIVFVPCDKNGKIGMITRQDVSTASMSSQPYVEVDKASLEVIEKNNSSYYRWTYTPNSATTHYYSYVCVGSKEFDSYKRDDKGLLAAWFMLPRLTQIPNDIYHLELEHFNNKDTQWHNEYFLPKQSGSGVYEELERRTGDKYIQIVTWAFSNNSDDSYSKRVNVVNAEIVENPDNPGHGVQVIIMDGVNRNDFSELGSLDKTSYTLSTTATSLSFGTDASSQTVSIYSNDAWDVSTSESWISLDKSYGSGNGTIKISVTKNTTTSARNGAVTVSSRNSGKKVTILVNQAVASYSLSASTTSLSFGASQGSKDVSITSNDSWTISTSSSWLSLSKTSGSGNSTFTVYATENSGSDRSGVITINGTNSGKSVTISVTQAKNSEINRDDFPDDKPLDVKSNNIRRSQRK